jgi:chromate transport protein ChrA
LWANHIAVQVVLPGVWKVARASHDKIKDSEFLGRSLFATRELEKEINMLWTIFVVLLILWLLGFSLHVAGGLIHLLLVVALVILVINLVSGRRVA